MRLVMGKCCNVTQQNHASVRIFHHASMGLNEECIFQEVDPPMPISLYGEKTRAISSKCTTMNRACDHAPCMITHEI